MPDCYIIIIILIIIIIIITIVVIVVECVKIHYSLQVFALSTNVTICLYTCTMLLWEMRAVESATSSRKHRSLYSIFAES